MNYSQKVVVKFILYLCFFYRVIYYFIWLNEAGKLLVIEAQCYLECQPKFHSEILCWLSSHPGLRWLYVFSSFPLRPPQQLLPLMSKPFQLNLRYFGQRIYRSVEIYMTYPWPWPKVTALSLISKNLFVCTIKWEPLIPSLQSMAALLS